MQRPQHGVKRFQNGTSMIFPHVFKDISHLFVLYGLGVAVKSLTDPLILRVTNSPATFPRLHTHSSCSHRTPEVDGQTPLKWLKLCEFSQHFPTKPWFFKVCLLFGGWNDYSGRIRIIHPKLFTVRWKPVQPTIIPTSRGEFGETSSRTLGRLSSWKT